MELTAEYGFFVGIDWATEAHQVTVVDPRGNVLNERSVPHSGAAITELIDWLIARADGDTGRIAVAIEVPRGALVEMLYERGIAVYSINPKQLDRLRDRHTVAGAKDDRLDAYVLGDSLRTDLPLFRRVKIDDPVSIQLREFSRLHDDLREELSRLTNRLRDQLYRFFPQMLRLCPAANEPWFWDLVKRVPSPARAAVLRPATIRAVLQKHRIRRLTAEDVLTQLRTPPVRVAPGTLEAARGHIEMLLPRLQLVHAQQQANDKRLQGLLEKLGSVEADDQGQKHEHRDAAIILSMPGIGIHVAATMLGEAAQALAERDYDALRTHSGQAPVTRRSGKRKLVLRRRACNSALADALYHAARVHVQRDPAANALYAAHRQQGASHGRALRSIGDRMLRILVAMLRTRTLYDPDRIGRTRSQPADPSSQAADLIVHVPAGIAA